METARLKSGNIEMHLLLTYAFNKLVELAASSNPFRAGVHLTFQLPWDKVTGTNRSVDCQKSVYVGTR